MGRTDHPSSLYKYFGPSAAKVLESGLLRYTPMGAFNDPFEGSPEITGLSGEEKFKKQVAGILPEETRRAYDALPRDIRQRISEEQMLEAARSNFLKDQAQMFAIINTQTQRAIEILRKKIDEKLGAFCLSEVPDSILMWAHYASSHEGFVVEFDTTHAYFDQRKSESDEFRYLRRVQYREARPSGFLSEMDAPSFFLYKSGHWEYEREWRIFRALLEADRVEPRDPYPIHLFSFPRQAVRSVTLGARCSDITKARIVAALRSTSEYSSVELKRATPDASHYLIRIRREAT